MRGLRLGLGLKRPGGAADPYGPELITNGTFDSATTGWTVIASGSNSIVAGKMRCTSAGSDNGALQANIAVELGATYRLQATMTPSETDRARISTANASTAQYFYAVVGASLDTTFVAGSTAINIALEAANSSAWASAGQYADFDNVSLRKVL